MFYLSFLDLKRLGNTDQRLFDLVALAIYISRFQRPFLSYTSFHLPRCDLTQAIRFCDRYHGQRLHLIRYLALAPCRGYSDTNAAECVSFVDETPVSSYS